jgi:hypothetical protein
VALAGEAAHVVATGGAVPPYTVDEAGPDKWVVRADGDKQPVLPPSPVDR